MKKIKMLLLFMVLMFPICVFASGSIDINKSSVSVAKGGTATFVISATNAGGKLTISSSNTSVATVNKDVVWVENDGKDTNTTVTVTVTGVAAGTANIDIELTDVATFDEEELTGTKKVSVTVTDSSTPETHSSKLTDLKVDGTTVSGFSSTKTSYSLTTDKSSVNITATKEDSSATITGTGTQTLTYGVNTINVKVTSGSSTTTYVLSITRSDDRDGDIYLKELSLGNIDISFDKDIFEYEIEVNNDVDSVTITATPESTSSTVTGTGTKSLKVGSNTFNVRVVAQNGNAKVYKLVITRLSEGIDVTPIDEEDHGRMYTLTYNSNGGKACSPSTKKNLIRTAWGTLCTTTRKGYRFDGWYTSKTGGIKISSDTLATENLTVYARWIENPKTGIVTPVIALLAVAILSLVSYILIRRQRNEASL